MKKQSSTPQIRFQKYEDNWDGEKLINIFGAIRNAFVGTATPYYVENGNFYLESNNVKNGKINYNSQIFINDEFYEKQRDKWLKTNDIVMVQSGHVGHTAVIPEELNNTAAHALIVFTDYKKEVNPHFLNYQFQSNGKRKKLDLISTGNTIKHILASEMKNFKMDFPTFEEQSAIGSLFHTLDDLLESYKDNLTNYQSLKVTMISKMFPKAGETVPEIRLDGFEGEWKKLKLRDVVHTNPKSELPENFKYIDLESVVGTRIEKIREESKESAPSRAQRLAKKGDVFYQTVRPYQKNNCLFKLDEIDYVFSTGYAQLRPIYKSCDSDFLLILLQNNRFLNKVLDRCTGTSYPAINVNDLIEILIAIPSYEEQQVIGAYFSNLDNLINSYQEKLSQLETLKKKLLQDMFI